MDTEKLRKDLRTGNSTDLRRRRNIILLSIGGMVNMALSTLHQMGIIKRLPEPAPGFDSNKVSTSDDAYMLGLPDGPLALAGFAANLPLAAFGGADRVKDMPLVPLVASAKSMVETAAAAWYLYRMPTKVKAWCIYCLSTALIESAIFALTLPEAKEALRVMRHKEGKWRISLGKR